MPLSEGASSPTGRPGSHRHRWSCRRPDELAARHRPSAARRVGAGLEAIDPPRRMPAADARRCSRPAHRDRPGRTPRTCGRAARSRCGWPATSDMISPIACCGSRTLVDRIETSLASRVPRSISFTIGMRNPPRQMLPLEPGALAADIHDVGGAGEEADDAANAKAGDHAEVVEVVRAPQGRW